jgi:predicted small lipoprotein YifL
VRPARPGAGALVAAAALLALLAGCGVKAPPRPPGAPERPAPHDVLQPAKEPRP